MAAGLGLRLAGRPELSEKIHRMTDVLVESVLERGFDGEAVCNEIENGVTDTDRIWWVQSEAILGSPICWKAPGTGAVRRGGRKIVAWHPASAGRSTGKQRMVLESGYPRETCKKADHR